MVENPVLPAIPVITVSLISSVSGTIKVPLSSGLLVFFILIGIFEYLTGKTHAVNPMTKERYGEILKRTQSALSDLWAESKSFTASERIQLLKLKFELNKELYEFAKEQADENNQL